MPSTYSTNLALELIGTGDQAGTWGNTTNTNLGTLVEQAISGYVTQAITDGADTVITIPPGATGVARNMSIECTGTLTAARNLIVPTNKKLYFIYNNTTGGFAVTVKVSGQTGVSVPSGAKLALVCNGTDVVVATNNLAYSSSLPLATGVTGTLALANGGTGQITANAAFNALAPSQTSASGKYLKSDGTNTSWDAIDISTADISGVLALANGGTGSSTASGARTNLGLGTIATQNASAVTITGGSITGITDLAIADGGTGASTAADARTNLGLGTIATQNSNSVTITGGSITGITDLAIADGGTGASTAADARTNLGLGTIATQNSSSVTITGGSITGITDLAIADGGTGASTAADARTNLNVPTRTGGDASGTWNISISGNAATATSATTAGTANALSFIVPVAGGGTGATTAADARANLNVPTRTGGDASGTWNISISGNAATATSATSATSATNATTAATVSTTVASGAVGTTQANADNSNKIATTTYVQNMSLGWGQLWQDVTADRASGTPFTNTTRKPIFVSVYSSGQDSSFSLTVVVDSVTISSSSGGGGGDARRTGNASFIVPPGSTYIVTYSGGSLGTTLKWAELR